VTQTGKWEGRRVELRGYAWGGVLFQRFRERMARDGFEGPAGAVYDHSLEEDIHVGGREGVAGAGDERGVGRCWMCRTDLMAGLFGDVDEEAGHWVLYEIEA
jgi:hypothetical protein